MFTRSERDIRTIHLVSPSAGREVSYPTLDGRRKSSGTPLGLAVTGSMVSKIAQEQGFGGEIKIQITDGHLDREPVIKSGDLLLITTMAATSQRANSLGYYALEEGAIAVFGGPQATVVPQEFMEAGTVFRGNTANSPAFGNMMSEYLQTGNLGQQIYSDPEDLQSQISLAGLPIDPALYRQYDRRTIIPLTFLSIGCKFKCYFCTAYLLSGGVIRSRPAEEVIEELFAIRQLKGFYLADSNPPFSDQFIPLLEGLARQKIPNGWTVELSMNNLRGEEGNRLLSLLRTCSCQRIVIGVESPFSDSLIEVGKTHNVSKDIEKETTEMVARCHKSGIKVSLLLIVGFRSDDCDRIKSIAGFIKRTGADGANISILTPLPGTPFQTALEADGMYDRSKVNPEDLDLKHMVWNHPQGQEEIQRAYRELCEDVWSLKKMLPRMINALFLAGPPASIRQRLASSVGFELALRDQHLLRTT